ncbi:sensor histidine kinase [candidate division WOR-3 bacterium]|nr:sensor histidine kinase [candidate division WOR-3 bacterium]
MDDLSLHVLDILENSTAAGATEIEVRINEDIDENLFTIEIEDNGKGMDQLNLSQSRDPFFTTKDTRRVGLGLSMLAQACGEAGGNLEIRSEPGRGTVIKASFVYRHIDRKPLGSMAETIAALIAGSAGAVRLVYRHCRGNREFIFDTAEITKTLDGVAINHPEILSFIKEAIESGLESLSERSNG